MSNVQSYKFNIERRQHLGVRRQGRQPATPLWLRLSGFNQDVKTHTQSKAASRAGVDLDRIHRNFKPHSVDPVYSLFSILQEHTNES